MSRSSRRRPPGGSEVCALALLCLSLVAPAAARAGDCDRFHDPRYVYEAEIVEVIDGDTIVADIDLGFRIWLRHESLRLWGVDTPEVRGAEKAAGLEVRDLVASWLPVGQKTLIRTLEDNVGGDRTGSLHRYLVVVCPEGWSESVNARLLREGLAELSTGSKKELAEAIAFFGLSEAE